MRFVLIDRILELEPGERVVAERTVRDDEEYLRDHFPGFPVVPGVLLTEMMAQAAGKCLDAERRPRGKAMLAKILSASFRRWVRPGQALVIRATVRQNDERFATADCTVDADGVAVADARLFFTFLPLHELAGDFRDDLLEEFFATRRGR